MRNILETAITNTVASSQWNDRDSSEKNDKPVIIFAATKTTSQNCNLEHSPTII